MGSASGVFRVARIISNLADRLKSVSNRGVSVHSLKSNYIISGLIYLTFVSCSLAALIGCAGKSAWMGSAGSSQNSESTSATQISGGSELARRSIFSQNSDNPEANYSLDLVEREKTSEIEIAMPIDSGTKPQITSLDSPARLVIDLSGAQGPKSSTIDTPESLYISRIRVGAHPDKSRIVLDLNEGQQIVSDLEQNENGKFTVKLAKAEGALAPSTLASNEVQSSESANQLAETEVVEATQTAKAMEFDEAGSPAVHQGASAPTEMALNSDTPKFSDAVEEKPLASPNLNNKEIKAAENNEIEQSAIESPLQEKETAKPNHTASSPTIYSFQLQALSPSENTLVIEGDQLSRYTMKRTAPSEYVLRIPGASLSDGIQDTMVAPQGSGAIRSVRAKPLGDVVELRIFTSPEESLQVKSSKDNLVVAASSGFDVSNSLAQAKPELAKEAAKEEAKVQISKDDASVSADNVDSEISALLGEKPRYTGRLISLDLQDTDIDNALRIIAEVSNLNIIASDEVTGKITLRLIDVPWDQALDVILKTNGLDMIQENNVIRIAPVEKLRLERESLKQARQAEEELEPLSVRYVRISYAKAAELKPLVESVLSERGSVAYDDRTNQLIIKDIRKGVVNVAELIAKLDLRTPQVLLETQIVEATRNLTRDLGSEFGFNYVQSPATGNATGSNFPNSIVVGGSGPGGNLSSFPGADSSAITFLLESADGTKSLSTRLTALEQEGRVKIVSRPAVATTNNKQAMIKSVETIRVRQPDGGTTVATGQGASASGSASSATEEIEIGIILEVTPQASPDYYVLLDINAKSSTLGSTVVDGIPSEIERSATSSVLVSSGQTFAMGGIYKTVDSSSVEGVPFLKDIPVLGHLFRRSLTTNSDEELLFFITPRIIEGSFDDAAMKAT